MDNPTVLVVGPGDRAWRAAVALSHAWVDVTLCGAHAPENAPDHHVDVRADVSLVGFTEIDRHVEGELSDGRVENFDVIVSAADDLTVISDPDGLWRRVLRRIAEAS